jgi:hypothetical protein
MANTESAAVPEFIDWMRDMATFPGILTGATMNPSDISACVSNEDRKQRFAESIERDIHVTAAYDTQQAKQDAHAYLNELDPDDVIEFAGDVLRSILNVSDANELRAALLVTANGLISKHARWTVEKEL